MADSTRRFLLGQRSKTGPNPSTWDLFGGRGRKGETEEQAARREVKEEAGISLIHLQPLSVTLMPGRAYHTFLARLRDEITPKLNPEHQAYRWCLFDDWPNPLHPGVQALLDDPESVERLHNAIR